MTSRAAAWALVGVAIVAPLACHPSKPQSPDRFIGKGAQRVDPDLLPKRSVADPKFPPNPPSFPIAMVPEKSVGPFLMRRHDGAMAAYLGPADGAPRRVIALPLGSDGSPFDPQIVAPVSADASTLVIRPSQEQGAYVAAWTDLVERGESINVLGLTGLGKPRAKPTEVARTQDNIVWIEIIPTARGEVMFWAEETQAAGVNLFLVPLAADGEPRGMPSAVIRGVTGWQGVAAGQGAALAVLTKKGGAATTAKAGTELSFRSFDADGRLVGAPLVVDSTNKRITDVDVANVAGTDVIAWTRRGAPEPEVMVAAVDAQGKLTAARSITARSGGASLVDVVGGEHGGVLAWQETSRLARGTRRLHVVPLPEAQPLPDARPATMSDDGVLEVDTAGAPELAPLEHGYALLARVRTCPTPPISGFTCDDPAPVPAYIRLDERAAVRETLPIFVGDTQERASLAWGLSCDKSDCFVLAAGAAMPAEVRLVRLGSAANHWGAPVPLPPPEGAPTVSAIDTLASADVYSELAIANVGDTPLLAALTNESAANAGGVVGGTVSLTPLDATGLARAPANVATKRALTEGGVSMAAGEGVAGGIVGWVGRDNGHSAVHLTRIDALGKRTKEIQLTTAAGEASDVAVAWAAGGWVIAWVDTRDGNGEVYATKVDTDLRRIAREVRITNAPGDASDVAILSVPGKDGPTVWVAWADPRDSVKDGAADIFVARLKGSDATLEGPEQRVLATVPHSRSPVLAQGDGVGTGGPCLAWIEEAPAGTDPSGASVYGAIVGVLDATGKLVGDPARTHGAGEGFPTSVAIERVGPRLHMVLTRSTRDEVFLDGMTVAPGVPTRPFTLFGLEGPTTMDVSIAILGGGVYFNDQSEGGTEGRIRRATVAWK